MKYQLYVQYAVLCLEALDSCEGQPLSIQELSQSQGVPFADCVHLVHRLSQAGIVEVTPAGAVALLRPVEELTALEILQALWKRKVAPMVVQMLVGGRGLRAHLTRAFVQGTQGTEVCNG
jgi:DNA-binding IscR family transcriptional regulator